MNQQKARIWFFTDIHGSNECFRKFLRAVENENKPNVLIVGGDITGKQIVPLVEDGRGNFLATVEGGQIKFSAADLTSVKRRLADVGYYPYECDETGYKRLISSEDVRRSTIDRLIKERLEDWVMLADRQLPSREECSVFLNPGNDDPLFVDQILDRSSKLIRPEGKVLELPCGLKLLSTGFSNWTPWPCPRQCKSKDDEAELDARINEMTTQLSAPVLKRALFNFHCPPVGTTLDLANKIDLNTKQKSASLRGAAKVHVGSSAVRKAIEIWQPIAGLHGHIHEVAIKKDKIGTTACFNPGTDYHTGHLQGVFLQINSMGEIEVDLLTEERNLRDTTNTSRSLFDTLIGLIPGIGSIISAHQANVQGGELSSKCDIMVDKLSQIQNAIESGQDKKPPARLTTSPSDSGDVKQGDDEPAQPSSELR